MDLQSILGQIVKGGVAENISKKTGLSKEQIEQVASMGLPMIVGGLGRNVSSPEGAVSLDKALSKDHIKSPLAGDTTKAADDVVMSDGEKILGHVFGETATSVTDAIAKKMNVSPESVTKLLSILAPLVLAYIAKNKLQKKLDADGVSSELKNQHTSDGTPLMDVVDSILKVIARAAKQPAIFTS